MAATDEINTVVKFLELILMLTNSERTGSTNRQKYYMCNIQNDTATNDIINFQASSIIDYMPSRGS